MLLIVFTFVILLDLELCEIIPVVASVLFRQYLCGKIAILYDFL